MQDDDVRSIPLAELCEPWVVLRPVDRGSVEYLELRDSLADKGFLNSICVRPCKRHDGKHEVVDGLYRYTIACELRLPTVPCIVKYGLTDEDVLAAQIQANALRPETTATEYARQLQRITEAMEASQGRDVTIARLSARIHKNSEWISHQLSLLKLLKVAQHAVDHGEIPLRSAYALARVPLTRQRAFLEMAKTMQVREFVPIVNAWVKQFREGVAQGRLNETLRDFTPVYYLRSPKEIHSEYQSHNVGALAIAAAGCMTPIDAWYLALQWVLHLDEESLKHQREVALRRQQGSILEFAEKEEKEEEENEQ